LEEQIVGKNFTSMYLEIRIRKITSNKIKNIWPKTGQHLKNIKRNGKSWQKSDDRERER
jgi:hypothetical protein